jgi:hypothetical protein
MVAGSEKVGVPEQSPFATEISFDVPVSVLVATTPVVVVEAMHPVEREPNACSAESVPFAVCVI